MNLSVAVINKLNKQPLDEQNISLKIKTFSSSLSKMCLFSRSSAVGLRLSRLQIELFTH